jgi:ketosteroid isomerase-like protein
MQRAVRAWFGVVMALAVAIDPVGAQSPPAAPTPFEAMADTERAFARRALEAGWKQAFLDYFAEEAVGFQAGEVGLAKTQIAKNPDPPAGFTMAWEPRHGDMSGSGELGFLTGPVLSQAEGRPPRHQVYASIWKRQRDGTFKVVLDVGVPTPRAAAFSPGLERAALTNRFSGDYDDRTPPLAAADNVLNSALRASQARGYRGRLAPNARLHRPGVQPLVGETRILAWLAGQPRFRLGDGRYAESARSGDLGYTWGTYQLVRPVAAAPAGSPPGRGAQAVRVEEGFYARVWTRERTGQWRVALDVLQPQL